MNDTQLKVSKINSMQERLRRELHTIRQTCQHNDKEGRYKGNTGNWCAQDDSYWIDVKCNDCGKTWLIDSTDNKEEYRKFNGKIIK